MKNPNPKMVMPKIGALAEIWGQNVVPLSVMSDTPGRFYIGSDLGPGNSTFRESEETWLNRRKAEEALKNDLWTQMLPLEPIPLVNGKWTIGAMHVDKSAKSPIIDLVIACQQEWDTIDEAQKALDKSEWTRSNRRGLAEINLTVAQHDVLQAHCGL